MGEGDVEASVSIRHRCLRTFCAGESLEKRGVAGGSFEGAAIEVEAGGGEG